MNKLVSNFGDDEGNEVNFNGTVVQALMMMNGNELNNALDKGTMAKALKRGQADPIITELYLATLNRPPSARELGEIKLKMRLNKVGDTDAAAPFKDLMWALLNCNEFLLNH